MWAHKTGGIIIAMMMWWYDMEWQKFSLSTAQFCVFRFRFRKFTFSLFFFFWQTFMNASGRGWGIGIEKDSATKPPKTINRRTRWRLRAKRKRKSNDKKYTHGLPVAIRIEFHLDNFKQEDPCGKGLTSKDSKPKWVVSVCHWRAFYKQSISVAFYERLQRIATKWIHRKKC